ncbi:MAG: glycosyl hydrolase, partial [Acidobacteriota bacterium]|nr:glycosyl hydrolase [Acidobacteriota bacterium]
MLRIVLTALIVMTLPVLGGPVNKKNNEESSAVKTWDERLFEGMKYRHIGPFRGGRSAAVTGVPGQPTTFYMGATGGGVWVTHDGGSSWKNISDGFFGGSIGAVAVSEWDNNIIYVGGGEKTVRGNVSSGYGMWRTDDKGKTWKQVGLTDSRHIPRVRIHPKDPNLVYAAVMGHIYGPNEERGIFRTRDGGQTWEKILYVSDEVGAVDLAVDPNNARVMYASFWRIIRRPYALESGGEGSSIWKTTDGGDTWTEITRNKGLPQGTIGISGLSVSAVNSDRVWAIIEAEDGGVFLSDDAGKTWRKTNDERKLRQRAWYYTRIYADTRDIDTVYVMNVRFQKSTDGGRSFSSIPTPHGDHHDLWIDPDDHKRMVVADDGGAQVTFNGGESWSTYHNQPTAQFYRVTTDNHFPYRIYGAQQDNSTVRIYHRTGGGSITEDDWEPTAGGESGHIAPHPENPDIVYGGSYGGFLTRVNHDTGDFRMVNVWPDNPMGHGAENLKYRFQWNFPIFFSPHDPGTLYAAGNVLFKTHNEGQTWEAISPDLTRDDKSRMGSSGGPITKDNTSVEYYGTVFALSESPHDEDVLWAGTDDGRIHVT